MKEHIKEQTKAALIEGLAILKAYNETASMLRDIIEKLESGEPEKILANVFSFCGIPPESDTFCHDFLTEYYFACRQDPEKFLSYCTHVGEEIKRQKEGGEHAT